MVAAVAAVEAAEVQKSLMPKGVDHTNLEYGTSEPTVMCRNL